MFYVCLYEKEAAVNSENVFFATDDIENAKRECLRLKVFGARVADGEGNAVFFPYTKLQCDILREAKNITDYVRVSGFTYGDAPVNPAIDHTAKKVSCDRLVNWALYNVGFQNQPYVQGVVISAFPAWCEEQKFEKIRNIKDIQPGDVMLVKHHPAGYPLHGFIYAGEEDARGFSKRYDCGSDVRIQSVQPFTETTLKDPFELVAVYRPRVTQENNKNYDEYKES